MITNKLSDLDEQEAIIILKKYILKDKIFTRSQSEARSGKIKLDLDYDITRYTDKMYLTKNNSGDLKKPYPKNKDKYVYAENIPKENYINPIFLNRLDDNRIFTRIQIKNYQIKEYISLLDDFYQVLIYKSIFKDVRSKGIDSLKNIQDLDKIEKEVKKLSYQKKIYRIKKAFKALYDLIVFKENEIIEKMEPKELNIF